MIKNQFKCICLVLISALFFKPVYLNDQKQDKNILEEGYEKDPLVYRDDSGNPQKISDPTEEFYYNRIHTVQLEGSTGETVYWVNLYMGSPPQKQTAIIDTGSSLLAFPCSQCQSECGNHLNKQYNLTESYSAQKMTCNSQFDNYRCTRCTNNICNWSVNYMEGSSIGGFMAVDYIVFGDEIQDFLTQKQNNNMTQQEEEEYFKYINHERVQIPFGCTTRETHLFKTQVPDGIIGLAPSSNQGANPPSIIDRIFSQHKDNNEELVFSLCLNSINGGYMSVGGYNHELHLPNAETKVISYRGNTGFYDVTVKEVRMGGKVLTTSIPNPILDSGTTLVFGPSAFIRPMISEINRICKEAQQFKCGNAKNYSGEQVKWMYTKSEEFPTVEAFFNSFPSFEFVFGDVVIEWKAHGYLYVDPENGNPNLFQFAFETYQSTNKVYLGGPFFKNYDILFDKRKNQVHFTPSTCTLPHVNSVLMNLHTSKIRKTLSDDKFIGDLKEFQKTFNYTNELFGDKNKTIDYENKPNNTDNDTKLPINPEAKKYDIYYNAIIIVLVFFILVVVLCLCKKSTTEDKVLIPLQNIEHGQLHDDSNVQDHNIDKDEDLKSEEDNQLGYKNDPIYKAEDFAHEDDESQKGSPSQNAVLSDEQAERYKALQE